MQVTALCSSFAPWRLGVRSSSPRDPHTTPESLDNRADSVLSPRDGISPQPRAENAVARRHGARPGGVCGNGAAGRDCRRGVVVAQNCTNVVILGIASMCGTA